MCTIQCVWHEACTGAEVTTLVEAAKVEDAVSTLVCLAPCRCIGAVTAEHCDLVDCEEVCAWNHCCDCRCWNVDEEQVEVVVAESCFNLRVEVEPTCVGTREVSCRSNDATVCPGKSRGALIRTRVDCSCSEVESCHRAGDAGVTCTNEIVHTTCCKRSGTDALTSWVVVDRLATGINFTRLSCWLADIRAVGIIKIEDESRWEAHWLDRNELVGNEATEHAANDWECDVREALDLSRTNEVTTAGRESVALLEDLCCLVLEKLRHKLTLLAVEATEEACAAPLLSQTSALGTDVLFFDALREVL